MSSERWLAVTALAGMVMAVTGAAQWLAQQQAASVPRVVMIELPGVSITARRERVDEPADDYAQLRVQVRWVATRVGHDVLLAPDYASRMLLAKSAAQRANLAEVGLSFRDVYGIVNAETSWAPRPGASRDGTPNLGIAQFEPATARALGVRNPEDAVEAVHAVAMHMKEAALWSRERLRGLKLSPKQREQKLREGVSVYYNLSSRARNGWNGMNTDELPIQTQRHIVNAKLGAQEATFLEARLRHSDGRS
jgi:hypothetical protein